MNERIKQLAEQAGIEFVYDPTETPMRAFVECWEDELDKFAELIVRECACLSYFDDSGNPEVEEALEFWRKNMLKHFGVEA